MKIKYLCRGIHRKKFKGVSSAGLGLKSQSRRQPLDAVGFIHSQTAFVAIFVFRNTIYLTAKAGCLCWEYAFFCVAAMTGVPRVVNSRETNSVTYINTNTNKIINRHSLQTK